MSERDTGQEARDAMANVRAGMGVIRTHEHTAAVPNIQQDIGSAFRAKREEIERLNQRIATLESEKQQLVLDLLSMTDENIALASELAATKRECEGLRELRRCVIAEAAAYRHYEQGDPFMVLMGLQDKAVAAQETTNDATEGGGA